MAPLDVLVAEHDGRCQFHVIETNGTGIGGLTNMTAPAVAAILKCCTHFAEQLPGPNPLVLVAISGKESSTRPRQNKLLYEKMMYADALKQGLEVGQGPAVIRSMPQLLEDPSCLGGEAAIVLGYIKDFLEHLCLEADGRLTLFDRPVTAGLNDRFCLNVLSRFGHQVDLTRFQTLNRCFLAGADKGVAYALLNRFNSLEPNPLFPPRVRFARASCRIELIRQVLAWLRQGRKLLIKPQGTGLGHGIEFFVAADEVPDHVIDKIDHSIRLTEHYYGIIGGAFPYTLCEFVDAKTIQRSGHALDGHKYELRVVVYQNQGFLEAFPTIVKVSSQGYDAAKPARLSLINNITTSAEAKKTDGVDHMLPLSNRKTLELLDLDASDLESVSAYCTRFIRYVLDQVQEQPQRFGLPDADQRREAHAFAFLETG